MSTNSAEHNPPVDLVAPGTLRPPTVDWPVRRTTGPIRTDDEAGELLRAMRDEERY